MITQHITTLHLDTVVQHHAQDMTDKIVAITGTTSGTGFVCAREIAKKGATVLLLNRESKRAAKALKQLKSAVPGATFDPIVCDLQHFESVQKAVETIMSKYNTLDVLINNAGVMALKDEPTVDGYDVQMQTNCISHFLLTKALFSLLKNSQQARIINHTSMARLGAPLHRDYFKPKGGNLGGNGTEEDSLNFRGPRWERYHQTKLANCAFTYGLKKKLEAVGITNIIPLLAHPGLALTNLQSTSANHGGMEHQSKIMEQAQSAEDGATGIIRAAMDEYVKSGDFFGPKAGWKGFPDLLTPEQELYSDSNIQINWEGCEKAVGTFVF